MKKSNGSSSTTTSPSIRDEGPDKQTDPAFDLSIRRGLRLGRTAGERREAADGHRVHGRLRIERDRSRLFSALEAAERAQTRAHAALVEAEGRGLAVRQLIERLFVYLASAVTIGITVGVYHEGPRLLRWLVGGALLGLAVSFTLGQLVRRWIVAREQWGLSPDTTNTRLASVLFAVIAGFAGLHSASTANANPIITATAWLPPAAFALLLSLLLVRNAEHEGEQEQALLSARRAVEEADREVARLRSHLDRFRTTDSNEILGDADALAASLDVSDTAPGDEDDNQPRRPNGRPRDGRAMKQEDCR